MFLHISKCLKIHQLNITKIIKKDYKKNLVQNIKFFIKKKQKQQQQQQYGREQYKNLPEDEKQKLVEYRKKHKMKKTPYYNYKKL